VRAPANHLTTHETKKSVAYTPPVEMLPRAVTLISASQTVHCTAARLLVAAINVHIMPELLKNHGTIMKLVSRALKCWFFGVGIILESSVWAKILPVKFVDCSDVQELRIATGMFGINVISDEPEFTNELSQKLERIACRTTYAAWRMEQRRLPWLNGLRFEISKLVKGESLQAAHEGIFNHKVLITTGLLRAMNEDQLLWTIGHELGHGVHNHQAKKNATRVAGFVVAVGGAWLFAKGRTTVAVVLAATGMTAVVCGPGLLSLSQELDADIYGLRMLNSGLGVGLIDAKNIAVSAVSFRGLQPAERCKPSQDNLHHSVEDRIDALNTYSNEAPVP
jgi:Zn-dependent protease with chaperone function